MERAGAEALIFSCHENNEKIHSNLVEYLPVLYINCGFHIRARILHAFHREYLHVDQKEI